MTCVPEWLEAEFMLSALSGQTCADCGSPEWMCAAIGDLILSLQLLSVDYGLGLEEYSHPRRVARAQQRAVEQLAMGLRAQRFWASSCWGVSSSNDLRT